MADPAWAHHGCAPGRLGRWVLRARPERLDGRSPGHRPQRTALRLGPAEAGGARYAPGNRALRVALLCLAALGHGRPLRDAALHLPGPGAPLHLPGSMGRRARGGRGTARAMVARHTALLIACGIPRLAVERVAGCR